MRIDHPTSAPSHPVRQAGTLERKKYLDARVQQAMIWLNGRPVHNTVTGECVLNFECCFPNLGPTPHEEKAEFLRTCIERRDREFPSSPIAPVPGDDP